MGLKELVKKSEGGYDLSWKICKKEDPWLCVFPFLVQIIIKCIFFPLFRIILNSNFSNT